MAQQELRIVVKADGTAQVTRQLDGVNRSIQNVENSANQLSTRGEFFKGMIGGALTAVGAYFGLRTAIRTASQSLNEFLDAFSAMRELQNVLNTTGRAAEFTAQGLSDMATEIQSMTGIGNEDILRGATMGLLRFDNIGKDIFPRAQQMAIDLSKRLGGIETAAKTLGLALSNPTLGINKMRRAGIDFTAAQREMITALAESGDLIGAQTAILRILETDYHNAAMAGVTGATMLKTAWGEYLETIGGSLSVFDGVKRGLAAFFFGIAQDSDSLSKAQMKHILDVQEQWAIFTQKAMQYAKTALTYFGGLVKGFVGGLIGVGKVAWGALIDIFEPDVMKSPLQKALQDLKKDGDQWAANWDSISGNFKNTNNENIKSIEAFYDAQRKLVSEGKNPFSGADMAEGEDAGALLKQIDKNQSQATERLRDMQGEMLSAWSAYYTTLDQYSTESIQAQADLYKYQLQQQYGTILSMQQVDEMYNAKLWELRDTQLAHFAENHEEMVERLGNTTGDMLSAWAAYYTTLDQYSNESIEHQANLYKYQLQQQYGTILSMQQIDEMYNAKLWELRDAQLAHFKEVNAQLPEIAKTDWEKMTEYAVNAAKEMQSSGLNLLENSIYDLISGTYSLKNVWANAWAAMEQIALRAMAEIITKMLTTISLQKLLGLGFGVLGIGSAVIGAPGASDIPSMPIASITPSMPSIPTGGNTNFELLTAINGLRSDIANNQNPTFNLTMDGVPLRNALNRVEKRLNYLGANS